MRAISRLRFEDGISTVSWAAVIPLRTRVRKSAMGSVIDIGGSWLELLPAALGHPGNEAVVGQLAQADPAEAELAVDGAGAAAPAAAAVLPGLELGGACLAHALGRLGHVRQASSVVVSVSSASTSAVGRS